jgi:hypothetical protein
MRERRQHRDLRDVAETDNAVADGAGSSFCHYFFRPLRDRELERDDLRGTFAPFFPSSAPGRFFRFNADSTVISTGLPNLAITTSALCSAKDMLSCLSSRCSTQTRFQGFSGIER